MNSRRSVPWAPASALKTVVNDAASASIAPCGTGNSARLAAAVARGLAKPGDRFTAYSIIGSTFEVAYADDTLVAGRPAVQPVVSGRGWIHGLHQIGIDPTVPFQLGHSVGDTWGDAFDLLA